MSIYTNNSEAMEALLEPTLWKFVEIKQVSPTKADVICKTSADDGVYFVRSTISIRPTSETTMVVSLVCNFLNAKYKAVCPNTRCRKTIDQVYRYLLSKQESAYYGETSESWLDRNLDIDEPEVHER